MPVPSTQRTPFEWSPGMVVPLVSVFAEARNQSVRKKGTLTGAKEISLQFFRLLVWLVGFR